MSPGDVEWTALSRVEISRARLATVSHRPQEGRTWHLKKSTRQEGRSWKGTKAESTPPLYAGRQPEAGSLMQIVVRKSAQSRNDPRRWPPESCPRPASKGDCVNSRRLPGQQSGSRFCKRNKMIFFFKAKIANPDCFGVRQRLSFTKIYNA